MDKKVIGLVAILFFFNSFKYAPMLNAIIKSQQYCGFYTI